MKKKNERLSEIPDERLSLTRRVRDDDQEEEVDTRPLEFGLLRRMFAYTKPHRKKRNWLIFLTVSRAFQTTAMAWSVGEIIGGPIAGKEPSRMAWAVLGYALLSLVTEVMFHFRQRLALELGESVINQLRADIFAKMQSMPMGWFSRTKVGRIIGRVTSDTDALRSGIQDVFFVGIVQFGQMLVTAVILLWMDWMMFLVLLTLAPVLLAIHRYFRGRLSRQTRRAQESYSRITATLAESVNGIRVTQGFAREEFNAGLFRQLVADHSRYNMAHTRTSARLPSLLELNSQFFIAALLFIGGWRTLHGTMEIGEIVKFLFLANLFFAPILILGNQYSQALVAMAGAERVFRLLDEKPDWVDASDAQPLSDPRRSAEAQKLGVDVEFRNVSFAYEKERPVLHEITFAAKPGQVVALVGHTGSGKSSVLNLVSKFYLPTSGEVLLDGREVRSLTADSIHAQMGIVQQNNFLFSGTILENIRMGNPQASDEDVRDALRKLDALEMVETLPLGLATEVGERGASLSGGQRQIICFARAMVANPRLLLLDEATSAIDTLTEHKLQHALERLLAGRTSFVVAHRLSTIRRADLVLVLDQGRIVERGTHQELLALGGRYAELHRQFSEV